MSLFCAILSDYISQIKKQKGMGTLKGILLFFLYFTYISKISVKIKLVVYVIQYPVSHSGYIFQKLQQKK